MCFKGQNLLSGKICFIHAGIFPMKRVAMKATKVIWIQGPGVILSADVNIVTTLLRMFLETVEESE